MALAWGAPGAFGFLALQEVAPQRQNFTCCVARVTKLELPHDNAYRDSVSHRGMRIPQEIELHAEIAGAHLSPVGEPKLLSLAHGILLREDLGHLAGMNDAKRLALAVLQGDDAAALALADLVAQTYHAIGAVSRPKICVALPVPSREGMDRFTNFGEVVGEWRETRLGVDAWQYQGWFELPVELHLPTGGLPLRLGPGNFREPAIAERCARIHTPFGVAYRYEIREPGIRYEMPSGRSM